MTQTRNWRLDGSMVLRSPLSHIGETLSTTSYLVQEPILQADGGVAEVFCYSGNAWRGQLRDLAATYMLERIGAPRLSLDAFHLLFSGGRLGGASVVDIGRARELRAAIPMVSVWGGGVGSQILSGKLRVGNAYPVCREAIPALPLLWHDRARRTGYGQLTFEKSFSRRDDARIDGLVQHLVAPAEKPKRAGSRGGDVADQMRMGAELLCTGATLVQRTWLMDMSDVEMGAFVSALHAFASAPAIGGQVGRGHGLVDLHYEAHDLAGSERHDFAAVVDGEPLLGPAATAAKDAYDTHLREIYDALLAGSADAIRTMLLAG